MILYKEGRLWNRFNCVGLNVTTQKRVQHVCIAVVAPERNCENALVELPSKGCVCYLKVLWVTFGILGLQASACPIGIQQETVAHDLPAAHKLPGAD